MQVNSAQDYLTRYKRRVLAANYYTTPPEQKDKTNSLWLANVANGATTRFRKDTPVISAWGAAPAAGPTYTNSCSNCSTSTGAPGTFQTVNTKDVLSIQALRPIGVRATSVIT
jgi:hypothetical protein